MRGLWASYRGKDGSRCLVRYASIIYNRQGIDRREAEVVFRRAINQTE